jgi:GTP-binding protein
MLIDDITIEIKSGRGGDGSVYFNRVKMSQGPTGASGGYGGSVYFEGVSDLNILNSLKNAKVFEAEDGERGQKQFRDGATGKDLTIKVPVGTVIHNITTGENIEIVKIGEVILGARGGRGGRGNFHFRSATNTSPKEFEEGRPGAEYTVRLELKLIADIGLVGLPNAGKSSLLNTLTNAKSKVANYNFTTLEPHLGVYYELILADVPGLIEGASDGKGLGIKFLRHVERTRIIFHLVSVENEDVAESYRVIREELGAYNKELLQKDEYVFLSKCDMVSELEVKNKLRDLKKVAPNAMALSIIKDDTLSTLKKILNTIIKEKTVTPEPDN